MTSTASSSVDISANHRFFGRTLVPSNTWVSFRTVPKAESTSVRAVDKSPSSKATGRLRMNIRLDIL